MTNAKDRVDSFGNTAAIRPPSDPGVCFSAHSKLSVPADIQLQVPLLIDTTKTSPLVDEQLLADETPTVSPKSDISSNVEWL